MKTNTKKTKVIRSSFVMFLNWCALYDVKNIRFFNDYGYKKLYANAIGTDKGVKVRIETRAATSKFCAKFAEKCKSKGYNVDLPNDNVNN